MTPNLQQFWHTQSSIQTLRDLGSDPSQGLTQEEALSRLELYGPNEIEEKSGRSNWEVLVDQFTNVMLLMLIAVAIISGLMDLLNILRRTTITGDIPFKDTIAILAIVILNGLLGYVQEVKAEKALAALKQLSSPQVRVLRDGKAQMIPSEKLVMGDIMLIDAGTQICADGQLLEGFNLRIKESALTGEAKPARKKVYDQGLPLETSLGDRGNMVFAGTEVMQGRGKAIVTATAMATELGKIAEMLQGVETEPTPLQRRMGQLANALVTGSLVLVALVIGFGVMQSGWGKFQQLVEVSLSMAVAVVPEGLPAVITVTLAIGTQRMVKRHALIRKLPAVETLGSVNVICSDKTGTLTQNKMVVQEIVTMDGLVTVTGSGYKPAGEFLNEGSQPVDVQFDELWELLFINAVRCNDAILTQDDQGKWTILGDSTEGALLTMAGKAGFTQSKLAQEYVRLAEIPFSSDRKCMATLERRLRDDKILLLIKGSPECILHRCHRMYARPNILDIVALDEPEKQTILEQNDDLASRGLRVLGFAYRLVDHFDPQASIKNLETDLVWLGLVGMIDAARPEAAEAMAICKRAGIRTIMITGDHQLTAHAIAFKLGMGLTTAEVLTGQQIEHLTNAELETAVEKINLYARVSPEHKLRIVRALQKDKKFVAMTGDGVNDAPALKQADIGIAMGITGTDVSKEASDMVLLDDNFATIVAATEEGRVVYQNIRKFIKYILGSNIGEVIAIGAAPLLGLPDVPLIPLQILWMNLVTDGLPALALAMEPADPDVMNQPPFKPTESVFARGLGYYMIRVGLAFAVITIALMVWAYHHNPDTWKTMVFTSLCLAQMGHAIAVRSDRQLTIEINFWSNPYLLAAVSFTTLLQLALVYVPALNKFFGTVPLGGQDLMVCLGVSSLLFVWVELEKLVLRQFFKNDKSPT
jgi:Ca2+-transporting ATPase